MSLKRFAFLAPLFRPPFLICVAVLGMAAVLAGPVAGHITEALIKQPLQCRKPLHEMRRDALGPYRFVSANRLNQTMIDALGTDHYLSWILEDARETDPRSPVRFVHLDVTYYTGRANLVPHTPDVCRLGSGYDIKQPHENRTIEVPALAPGDSRVPVRVCTFIKSGVFDNDEPTVIYTFQCNGQFASTRNAVRVLVNNPLVRYAYYSKIEVSFFGQAAAQRNPPRERSIEAAAEFLKYLLPVLMKEHYPDWEAAQRGERPV